MKNIKVNRFYFFILEIRKLIIAYEKIIEKVRETFIKIQLLFSFNACLVNVTKKL